MFVLQTENCSLQDCQCLFNINIHTSKSLLLPLLLPFHSSQLLHLEGQFYFFFFCVCSRYLEWMHGHSVNDMSCVAAELRRKHLEQLLFPLVFKKITVELHNSQNGMACLLTGWNLQNRYSSWKHPTFPVMNVKTCVNRKADVNWLWKILSNLSVTGFDRCLKKETNLLFLLQATMAWGS